MGLLESVSTTALRGALDRATGAKAAKRLMVAIAYKDGVDVETLSERYGIPESTIYYWFDRFEDAPIDEAIVDEQRPGRPPKLSADQRATVAEWVRASPRDQGLDAEEWTADLLRERIHETFGVSYSVGHVRRLLDGLHADSRN